jgi:hypothetical protein
VGVHRLPPSELGTYYSNPVVAVIGGQRLLASGGGDGYVHAFRSAPAEGLELSGRSDHAQLLARGCG